MQEDMAPFPCCEDNKKYLSIVFRDYKRSKNPKGYYYYPMTPQGPTTKRAWLPAQFCPHCGVDIQKYRLMV